MKKCQNLLRNWKQVFCEFFSDAPAELEKVSCEFFSDAPAELEKSLLRTFPRSVLAYEKKSLGAIFSSFIFLSDAGKIRLEGEELTFEFARI